MKKNLSRILKGVLIALIALVLLFTAIAAYFVVSTWMRWDANREEGLRKISEYHYTIIEERARAFNPSDPFGAQTPTRIYDRNNVVIGEYAPLISEIVYIDEIDPKLETMILLMEDQQFYKHKGANYFRIALLAFKGIVSMRAVGGGSTISQQLVKLHLTQSEKTIRRKLYELFATLDVEKRYSKQEIFAMYVNTVYLGEGCYGFASASKYYFDTPLRNLRLAEYAMLVGMLPNPAYYSPIYHPERSRRKTLSILARMAKHEHIDEATVQTEMAYYDKEYGPQFASRVKGAQWRMSVNRLPYFNEEVRKILNAYMEKEAIVSGGLSIYTSADYRQGAIAKTEIETILADLNAKTSNTYEAALVSIDPRTGDVLAMIGGSGYTFANQFNRATMGRRQIGSLVKPFIYALAFERGDFPSSTIEDKAYSYKMGNNKNWSPKNYGGGYLGETTYEDALRKSINTVAVKLLHDMGLSYFKNRVANDIFSSSALVPNNLTLALGTVEMTPMDVALSYATLASYGYRPEPVYILRVEDEHGRVDIPELTPKRPKRVNGISDASYYFVNATLTKTLHEGGTGARAAKAAHFSYPVSAKSGTTSDFRDAWFAVYTPETVSIVWFGNDDHSVALPSGSAGGTLGAAALFRSLGPRFAEMPERAFKWTRPDSVESVTFCKDSGLPEHNACTNTYTVELTGVSLTDIQCSLDHGASAFEETEPRETPLAETNTPQELTAQAEEDA